MSNATDQAARWLADVPRRHPDWNRELMRDDKDGDWLLEADAIAAIARHLAPGDDLKLIADCELAAKVMADAGTFETGQSILREAAARLSALTAQVAESRISEPHDPGDFVGDIYYGHPVKTTMGTHRWTGTEWVALPSEAEALAGLLAEARAELATHRDRLAKDAKAHEKEIAVWSENYAAMERRLARMEGALRFYADDAWKDRPLDPPTPEEIELFGSNILDFPMPEVLHDRGERARSALTDGGSNG